MTVGHGKFISSETGITYDGSWRDGLKVRLCVRTCGFYFFVDLARYLSAWSRLQQGISHARIMYFVYVCMCVCVYMCVYYRMELAPYISRLAILSLVAGGRAPSMDPSNTGGTRARHGSTPSTRLRRKPVLAYKLYYRLLASCGCMYACTYRSVCGSVCGKEGAVQCFVRDIESSVAAYSGWFPLFGRLLPLQFISFYAINVSYPSSVSGPVTAYCLQSVRVSVLLLVSIFMTTLLDLSSVRLPFPVRHR
jgi:hypothetical protein